MNTVRQYGNKPSANWHETAFFGIHYDLHVAAKEKNIGRDLTINHLIERWKPIRPDWIQCDCKGCPGYTSWPTRVGFTAPRLVKDCLAIYRKATRRLGIKLGVHYCSIVDEQAMKFHPEWRRVGVDGAPHEKSVCTLSAYADQYMIPQMLEVIDKYDVDGFWVDCENWATVPCWCKTCRAEFKRLTGRKGIPEKQGDPGWDTWLAFHRDNFVRHVKRYADAVHARKATCLVCSNWMYTIRQPDPVVAPVDYLSGDYNPNWGADRAAIEARLLDCQNKTWDLMAWGFTWNPDANGSQPVMKPTVHLCQEVTEAVALGGGLMIYLQPQRSGWLSGWSHRVLTETAAFCRARKKWCFKSKTVPQAAILHLASHYYSCNGPLFNYDKAVQPVEGALHAFLETHRSTDILTEQAAMERMSQYKLVVIPEQTRLSSAMLDALHRYVKSGGVVMASGSHLPRQYGELFGVMPAGEERPGPVALPAGDKAIWINSPWQPVKITGNTHALLCRLDNLDPEKNRTRDIIATRHVMGKGIVIGIYTSIFREYFQAHVPWLRQLIDGLVNRAAIQWLVTLDGPPWIEMILRHKDGRLLINLINRGSGETLSPGRFIVDELPCVGNIRLRIRTTRKPASVSVAPGHGQFHHSYRNGILTVIINKLHIHNLVVVQPYPPARFGVG